MTPNEKPIADATGNDEPVIPTIDDLGPYIHTLDPEDIHDMVNLQLHQSQEIIRALGYTEVTILVKNGDIREGKLSESTFAAIPNIRYFGPVPPEGAGKMIIGLGEAIAAAEEQARADQEQIQKKITKPS